MEELRVGQPYAEVIEQPQPDLAEIYRDHTVTKFTLTKSIGDLMKLCPLDLEQMSNEAKNDYVIPLLNEAGTEIAPEHQAVFDDYLRSNALEPNYRIALTTESPDKPAPPIKVVKDSPLFTERTITKATLTDAVRPATETFVPEHNVINPSEYASMQDTVVVQDSPPKLDAIKTAQIPDKEFTAHTPIALQDSITLADATIEHKLSATPTTTEQSAQIYIQPREEPLLVTESITAHDAAHRPTEPSMPSQEKQIIQLATSDIGEFDDIARFDLAERHEGVSISPHQPEQIASDSDDENYQSLLQALPALEQALPAEPPAMLSLQELVAKSSVSPLEETQQHTFEAPPLLTSLHDLIVQRVEADDNDEQSPILQFYDEVAQITALLASQALPDGEVIPIEAQAAVIERLRLVTVTLLEALNLPADELTVQRFIYTIIQQERLRLVAERLFSGINVTQKASHEVKSEDWFARFGQMLLRLQRADHEFIGRVALTSWPAPAARV